MMIETDRERLVILGCIFMFIFIFRTCAAPNCILWSMSRCCFHLSTSLDVLLTSHGQAVEESAVERQWSNSGDVCTFSVEPSPPTRC